MRKLGLACGLVAMAMSGAACSEAPDETVPNVHVDTSATSPKGVGVKSGRHVVVFNSAELPGDAQARIAGAGGVTKGALASIGVAIVEGDANVVAKLAADGAVAAVGTEMLWTLPTVKYKKAAPLPAVTAPDLLWGAQWDQRRIKANIAWNNVSPAAQAAVTVAVIDTGVMSTHPDLVGKVVDSVATNYSTLFGCAGPPQPDPAFPFYFTRLNAFTNDPCEQVVDQESVQGHGTHVAGTIAASFGGGVIEPYGFPGIVVGVAPGVNIAAYKVFDRFVVPGPSGPMEMLGASDFAVFSAIADAASKRRAVINMSLGGLIDRTDPQQNASWLAWNRVVRLATQRGTLVVAAAGNESLDNNGHFAMVPSDVPGVVSVSATASNNLVGDPFPQGFPFGTWNAAPGSDVLAEYSNFGAAVNVAAPGGNCGPAFDPAIGNCDPRHLILSTVTGWDPASGQMDPYLPAWAWYAGTSMASPHVAGVAALVKAKNPSFSPAQVRARIEQTATPLGDRQKFGRGLVDADLATR